MVRDLDSRATRSIDPKWVVVLSGLWSFTWRFRVLTRRRVFFQFSRWSYVHQDTFQLAQRVGMGRPLVFPSDKGVEENLRTHSGFYERTPKYHN